MHVHQNIPSDIRGIRVVETYLLLDEIEQLRQLGGDDWGRVKYGFINDFCMYNRLLLRLHFKRHVQYNRALLNAILTFLTIGYLSSRDIRYFNEFLWFGGDRHRTLSNVNRQAFEAILVDNRFHPNPVVTREEVEQHLRRNDSLVFDSKAKLRRNEKPCLQIKAGLKVATLGPCFLFRDLSRKFREKGIPLKMYFFPPAMIQQYRILFYAGTVWQAIFKFMGVKGDMYIAMHNGDEAHEGINEPVDIGVHRLGFIIKENLIKAFRMGILNDHWAVLPFIRGRSTIAYSLLFGFPLIATVHFVDKGVDTGRIVSYFRISIDRADTLKKIRKELSRTKNARYLLALNRVGADDASDAEMKGIDNPRARGLQYFSMHPFLVRYVERHVLRRYDDVSG